MAVQDDVSQIGAAAERAARLTHQLLAFGRREIIKPEIIDFNAIVGEVDGLLRTTIGEHVELITRCATNLEHVLADRGQMEQVLLNLAVNARDAMPTGGTLIIDTENFAVDDAYAARDPRLTAGPHVRLRVADAGTGMDRDTIERAFEPFFSTKPKEKGSGLGLATVYGIVNQAGGVVDLESDLGSGTTITILLPSVVSSVAQPDEPPRATRRSHGGETILVVEDEDLVLDVARRILTRHGYHVLAARGGAEALELISEHRGTIHLLLTDVVMPGLTGKQVAEHATKLLPRIRVLYMSGYPESVITSQGVVQRGIHLAVVAQPAGVHRVGDEVVAERVHLQQRREPGRVAEVVGVPPRVNDGHADGSTARKTGLARPASFSRRNGRTSPAKLEPPPVQPTIRSGMTRRPRRTA
jgi:CheY-like chemotaxis protein